MPAKTVITLVIALCFALAASTAQGAAPASAAPAGRDILNQKKIHSDYNEGNFEKVTAELEGFMSRNKSYSLEDSVFIAKHLAVVYSANPETREKGKYYMFRLLAMLPSAKLIDMYVSDEIDRIFDKVREEFLARQKSFGVDSSQMSLPAKSPSNRQPAAMADNGGSKDSAPPANQASAKSRKRNSTPFLVAGGAAIVAAGVTSYFMFADSPKKTEKTYVIP